MVMLFLQSNAYDDGKTINQETLCWNVDARVMSTFQPSSASLQNSKLALFQNAESNLIFDIIYYITHCVFCKE